MNIARFEDRGQLPSCLFVSFVFFVLGPLARSLRVSRVVVSSPRRAGPPQAP